MFILKLCDYRYIRATVLFNSCCQFFFIFPIHFNINYIDMKLLMANILFSFLRAAIGKWSKLVGLYNRSIFSDSSESSKCKIKLSTVWISFWGLFSSFVDGCLLLYLHILVLPSVLLMSWISFLSKDTSHIGLEPTIWPCFILITS